MDIFSPFSSPYLVCSLGFLPAARGYADLAPWRIYTLRTPTGKGRPEVHQELHSVSDVPDSKGIVPYPAHPCVPATLQDQPAFGTLFCIFSGSIFEKQDTRIVSVVQNVGIGWFSFLFFFPNNSLRSGLIVNWRSPKHIYYGSRSHSLGGLVSTSVPPFQSVQGCAFIAILLSSHPVPYNPSANAFVLFQNLVSVANVANSFVITFPIYGGCKANFL